MYEINYVFFLKLPLLLLVLIFYLFIFLYYKNINIYKTLFFIINKYIIINIFFYKKGFFKEKIIINTALLNI